jgi:hypothetical protein
MFVRFIPKPARGGPSSERPTTFRDFVTALTFAVLTPPYDALKDGAMSREPNSIDTNADGFVQAVFSTVRRVGAVARTKRKGLRPPLQRSILGAIARRRHGCYSPRPSSIRGIG